MTKEQLKDEFHQLSLEMARGVENGTFHYRETENKIIDFFWSKIQERDERVREEVERVLAIQNSGIRPNSEFEKGYTTAYKNISHTLDLLEQGLIHVDNINK